jgi:enamine deaminase RidA (YjgF/YER057c/UK114 family)
MFTTSSLSRLGVGRRLSEATIHEGTVYLAGQVPGESLNDDISAQTTDVLAQVQKLLVRAGSDKSRILQCAIFLRDIDDLPAVNAEWDAWVPSRCSPARTVIQAQLADARWLIEIVVVAALFKLSRIQS